MSADIPLHLADLDPQSLNQYLDGQVDLLRNDNIPIVDRAEQGHFLALQLKSEGLYLEAASLYEELAFLFARSGDGQAEQTLQTEAKYWRHFDTYQDPFVAAVEALKEDLSVSLQTNQFYPSQKITEAQHALLNHDVVTAKKSLEDLGWWILQNTTGYESGNNFDTLSVTTTLGPWSDPASTSIPDFLKPYWTQAKQMYDGALVQEDRETTLELLMLEAKEDQFNLSDEMQHEVHTAELGNSSGFFDKYVAYPFQSAVGTLNAEGYFLKKYEGRMAFRYLLQTILVSGKASSLDDAVKVALESNDPQVKENYESWQSWRDNFKQYGVGFTVTYDRNVRESEIYGRQDLDGYWREQITQAKNNNNYDKVLMFYGTILEADLVKAQAQIPYDQVLSIKAAAEQKASERKQSIWEPIIAQLKRQYPDKSDDELNSLAEKAFASVIEQYQQEQLQDEALTLLEKRGVFADGPFSKELRQEVFDDYQNAVAQKKEIAFEQKLTTMILIQVPLIMAGGWVAGLARAGTSTLLARGTVAVVGSEEAAAGVMATRAYTATKAILGTTVAGTTFNTTESILSSPIQGSAAFDNYTRGCALSTGMFAALDLYKVGYGAVANPWFQQRYATGQAQLQNGVARLTLTPGAEAMRSSGEIGGESLVLSGYGYFEEAVNGGPGILEDHSFGDHYADAAMTVLALRGGQKLAKFTLGKLQSNIKPGDNLNNADVVRRLADANIFLLSPKDFHDLAIRMGFPEMADVPALTDTQTGFVFINRGRIPAENPRASVDFLIEHEEVHRRLQIADFHAVFSQPKWAEVKQKYLDEIYTPNGGTKQLSDIEILEELVAHYRTWIRSGVRLTPQQTELRDAFGTLLEITGFGNHPIFGDLTQVPVVTRDRETRLVASWEGNTRDFVLAIDPTTKLDISFISQILNKEFPSAANFSILGVTQLSDGSLRFQPRGGFMAHENAIVYVVKYAQKWVWHLGRNETDYDTAKKALDSNMVTTGSNNVGTQTGRVTAVSASSTQPVGASTPVQASPVAPVVEPAEPPALASIIISSDQQQVFGKFNTQIGVKQDDFWEWLPATNSEIHRIGELARMLTHGANGRIYTGNDSIIRYKRYVGKNNAKQQFGGYAFRELSNGKTQLVVLWEARGDGKGQIPLSHIVTLDTETFHKIKPYLNDIQGQFPEFGYEIGKHYYITYNGAPVVTTGYPTDKNFKTYILDFQISIPDSKPKNPIEEINMNIGGFIYVPPLPDKS